MLERISPVFAVLRDAAAADGALREALAADIDRRRDFQRTLVGLVHARGPFRDGLSQEQAAETYSALANPDLYLLLTTHHRVDRRPVPGVARPQPPAPRSAAVNQYGIGRHGV